MSRVFFSIQTLRVRTCLLCDVAKTSPVVLFLFLPDFSSVKIFLTNLDNLKPNIFGRKKNKKKREVRPRDGSNTCAKCQGLSLNNGVDIWMFVRRNAQDMLCPSNDLVLVRDPAFRSILLNIEHTQVRSSIFCAKNSTDMPWSTSNRVVKNAAQSFFSSPFGKRLKKY